MLKIVTKSELKLLFEYTPIMIVNIIIALHRQQKNMHAFINEVTGVSVIIITFLRQ